MSYTIAPNPRTPKQVAENLVYPDKNKGRRKASSTPWRRARFISTKTGYTQKVYCSFFDNDAKAAVLIPVTSLKFQNIEIQKQVTKFAKKYY